MIIVTRDKVTELFCIEDNFCKVSDGQMEYTCRKGVVNAGITLFLLSQNQEYDDLFMMWIVFVRDV